MPLQPAYVQAPDLPPLPFGLASVATPLSIDDPHQNAGIEWESLYCGPADYQNQPCDDTLTAVGSGGAGPGGTVTFSALAPEPGTYTFAWGDLTANGTQAGPNPSLAHAFATNGTYTVTVTGPLFNRSITVTVPTAATTTSNVTTKVSHSGTTSTAAPVVVYSQYGCRMPGDFPRAQERVVAMLGRGEGRAVEDAFHRRFLSTAATVDLTIGGAASTVVEGLAVLEDFAGRQYGGRPTIHGLRRTISLLGAGNIERHGTHLETILGSYVAAGGGYLNLSPASVAPAATESWLYVSGQVSLRSGAAMVFGPEPKMPPDNEMVAMAQRVFVPSVECFVAGIRVTNVPA